MPDEKTSRSWALEVGSLVRRLRDPGTPAESGEFRAVPEEASSQEAFLRIASREGRFLDFHTTLHPKRLFSIQARLAGPPSRFSQVEAAAGRRVVLTVPVALSGGERLPVRVAFHLPRGVEPNPPLDLIRAGQGRLPPDIRLLEFLFTGGEHEFRYSVELDQGIQVLGFEEVVDRRPVFQTVPPVAQMTAFLRAITSQRRTSLTILASLKGAASAEAREHIDWLQGHFRSHQDLLHPAIRTVHDLLERGGRIVSLQVLQAFALFLEAESGSRALRTLEGEGGVPLSPEAVLLVAEHFGLALDEAAWREAFPGFGEALQAVRIRAAAPRLAEARARLTSQGDQRTPVRILEQLARESNSRRAGALASALGEQVPDGSLPLNEGQMALLTLLSASGRRYHANTLQALCLFVDAEVGLLSDIDVARSPASVGTSMYAMVAVAGAFEVPLRGLVIESGASEAGHRGLEALVERAQAGLLAAFREPGRTAPRWRWLRSAEEASEACGSGLEFTGTVLGSFPILDQLTDLDLADLLDAGEDLVGVFQSDLDRTHLWRRLGSVREEEWRAPLVDGRRRSFSFLEGFSAYHFSRSVLAGLERVEDADLPGRRRVVAVYLDNRENRHYRCLPEVRSAEDLAPPPNSGLTWSHQVVRFPDVSRLPASLRELGQDALLGRSGTLSEKLRTLERMHQALGRVLTCRPEYVVLSEVPDVLERLHRHVTSPALTATLSGLMDSRTRDGLVQELQGSSRVECHVLASTLEVEAEYDFLALRLVYEMCRSDLVGREGHFKDYDEPRLRVLLRDRLYGMLEAPDPATRALGLRLLVTAEELPDKSERLAVEYELSRGLSDPEPAVGVAAAEGLLRLCLAESVPLPRLVELVARSAEPEARKVRPASASEIAGLDPDEFRRVLGELRRWVEGLQGRDPRRVASLGFVDEQGRLQEDRVKPLVDLMAGLNTACRLDGSLQQRRYFALVGGHQLEAIRGAVLDSWKVMALSQGRRLAEIASEVNPSEILLDYRFFLEGHGEELRRALGAPPFLGGRDQPLTVHHFRPSELVGPFRRRETSWSDRGAEESRFLAELLELCGREELRSIRVLRLSSAGGVSLEDLESHLPTFTTTRTVEPRTAEVFQLLRLRFAPVIHEMAFAPHQVGTEKEDLEDLQALLSLLQGRKHVLRGSAPSSSDDAPAAPTQPLEVPVPEPEIPDAPPAEPDDRDGIRRRASQIVQAFGLPEEMDRQVVNLLMAVGRNSLYDL